MSKTNSGRSHTNVNIERKLLRLQRDIFEAARTRHAAVAELTRLAGASFAASVEALANAERDDCRQCGEVFEVDELGASGMCGDCFDAVEAGS